MTTTRIALTACALLAATTALAEPPKDVLGFRALRWGDQPSSLGASVKIKPELSISPYKKVPEDLSVLGEKAEAISYDFDLKTRGLMGVSVFFAATAGMCERLEARITSEYGAPSDRSPDGKRPRRTFWERKSGTVTIECADGDGILTVDFEER